MKAAFCEIIIQINYGILPVNCCSGGVKLL
jgi:hypothetical protein